MVVLGSFLGFAALITHPEFAFGLLVCFRLHICCFFFFDALLAFLSLRLWRVCRLGGRVCEIVDPLLGAAR